MAYHQYHGMAVHCSTFRIVHIIESMHANDIASMGPQTVCV